MALFLLKPVFWNPRNYQQPAGHHATSGYPKATGYGHEEWNNASRLLLEEGGRRYRVFHTEGVGTAPIQENVGQTFIFMTASHDGIQQLVGIAGSAMGLMGDTFRKERERIVRKLSLRQLWKDAWQIPNVQTRYEQDREAFLEHWDTDLHWIPNWLCPEELFWWLDNPVTLNAQQITGKERLLNMFGSYTQLDLATVGRLMQSIPQSQRTEQWTRIHDAIQCAPEESLPSGETPEVHAHATTALATINARRGQGRFRLDLLQKWNGACAVSGLDCLSVLRASHIKPWADSNAIERLDSHNGLLLSANLDALFDKGLISFEDSGQMLISPQLSAAHLSVLGLPKPLRLVHPEAIPYLDHHRRFVFRNA